MGTPLKLQTPRFSIPVNQISSPQGFDIVTGDKGKGDFRLSMGVDSCLANSSKDLFDKPLGICVFGTKITLVLSQAFWHIAVTSIGAFPI